MIGLELRWVDYFVFVGFVVLDFVFVVVIVGFDERMEVWEVYVLGFGMIDINFEVGFCRLDCFVVIWYCFVCL